MHCLNYKVFKFPPTQFKDGSSIEATLELQA